MADRLYVVLRDSTMALHVPFDDALRRRIIETDVDLFMVASLERRNAQPRSVRARPPRTSRKFVFACEHRLVRGPHLRGPMRYAADRGVGSARRALAGDADRDNVDVVSVVGARLHGWLRDHPVPAPIGRERRTG